MLMEIPVYLADADPLPEEVVEDHPGYVPANGNWICRCGIGNLKYTTRCIKCKRRKED